MANKMLIDATHAEETRVVVLRGHRVEEFDFESASKKQLRGNIYLAKVTRVEPSLQAAFVDYGGNRHGFLAFSEIHPDYYQIPTADRQELLAEEAEAAADEENYDDAEEISPALAAKVGRDERMSEDVLEADEQAADAEAGEADLETFKDEAVSFSRDNEAAGDHARGEGESLEAGADDGAGANVEELPVRREEEVVEAIGGADALEEAQDRPRRLPSRRYKIQEVIKRRQVLLVQVVKEERGNKGAALTTYLSLAGRYSVLMPNTARGGGISRKITNLADRKRLKDVAQELEVPEGMGIILRTAGANRTKPEIKRDYEYLMRLWENVAELTLRSQAPALVYEEGSLVKRSIRDLYDKDIDEVTVAGEDAYREAKEFMRMLMPSHARNVKPYRDDVPLLTRLGIESQLEQMVQQQVRLPSGGYVVINQTEALVAVDVNSGRSTREHNIEDTALKTNLEAAEEIARQLRLRDLAGLIVIDFIDMDETRNNRAVERRLKDHLKRDRARIQVGRISHFGLLEMSRQRIRASVLESTMVQCPVCAGSGLTRSPSSAALQILRVAEEALIRDPRHDLILRAPARVALYILNNKRANLAALEERFGVTITIDVEDHLPSGTTYTIEKGGLSNKTPRPRPTVQIDSIDLDDMPAEEEAAEIEAVEDEQDEAPENDGGRKRRRRRRRRSGESEDMRGAAGAASAPAPMDEEGEENEAGDSEEAAGEDGADDQRRRRRGRRGGKRNRRGPDGQDNFAREPRLQPVVWRQPGEAIEVAPVAIEDNVAMLSSGAGEDEERFEPADQEMMVAAPAAMETASEEAPAADTLLAEPAAPAVPEPAPLEAAEPVMPRIPDLSEIVEVPAAPAEEAAQPRRRGWWSRRG